MCKKAEPDFPGIPNTNPGTKKNEPSKNDRGLESPIEWEKILTREMLKRNP
jgi:hypothetical protein